MEGNPPEGDAEQEILAAAHRLMETYEQSPATWIVVSNEVGLGVVPPSRLGAAYRDALGRVNQAVAALRRQGVFHGRRAGAGNEVPRRAPIYQRGILRQVMSVSSSQSHRASATAPGTCGELAQGMLDGILCMVTCPVDMYSTATVELWPGPDVVPLPPTVIPAKAGIHGPPDSPKAIRSVQETLDYLDIADMKGRLWLDSRLPRGKGMASSTADVAAAIVATAAAMGRELSPLQVAEIALGVEPSDGVMFPDVAVFDHREGRIARSLGPPPPMRVLILDFGGSVDTLEFNQADRDGVLKRLAPEMAEAASLIEDGISRSDPLRIGRGATLSAQSNQQVLFNSHLEPALELSREVGAVGVNVAHSGTVIGMLFRDDAALVERAAAIARQELPRMWSAMHRRIVGGGVVRE